MAEMAAVLEAAGVAGPHGGKQGVRGPGNAAKLAGLFNAVLAGKIEASGDAKDPLTPLKGAGDKAGLKLSEEPASSDQARADVPSDTPGLLPAGLDPSPPAMSDGSVAQSHAMAPVVSAVEAAVSEVANQAKAGDRVEPSLPQFSAMAGEYKGLAMFPAPTTSQSGLVADSAGGDAPRGQLLPIGAVDSVKEAVAGGAPVTDAMVGATLTNGAPASTPSTKPGAVVATLTKGASVGAPLTTGAQAGSASTGSTSAGGTSGGDTSAGGDSSPPPLDGPAEQLLAGALPALPADSGLSAASDGHAVRPFEHILRSVENRLNVSVDAPVKAPAFAQEFGDKVVWLAGRQGQFAEISLNPPNLGSVEVRLSVSSGEAGAQFFSANPVVRDAIEAALPKLRELMAQAGLNLGEAHVHDQAFTQGRDSEARERNAAGLPGGTGSQTELASVGMLRSDGSGLVDLYV